MEFLFQIGLAVAFLFLGFVFGQIAESRHYASIRKREDSLGGIMVFGAKFPDEQMAANDAGLVTGSAVISIDYFKRFVTGLRAIIGGRVRSYETLVDRARREAILRMKQQADERGANMVFNIKIETASISKGAGKSIGSVEVLAYGTAVIASDTPAT